MNQEPEQTPPEQIPPAQQPDESDAPSTVKRILSFLFVCFFIAILIGVGLTYYVYTKFLDGPALKAQFEQQVSVLMGVPVQVGDISLNFPTVNMANVRIGTPGTAPLPSAEIARISATPDLWDLLSGTVVFEHLQVASAVFDLSRDAAGKLVLAPDSAATGSPVSGSASAEKAAFPLRNFEGTNIVVLLRDQGLGRTFDLSVQRAGVSPELAGQGIPLTFEGVVAGLGAIKIDGAYTPAASRLTAHLSVTNVSGASLKSLLPQSVTLPDGVELSAFAADFSMVFGGKLELTNIQIEAKPGLQMRGAVSLESVSPPQGKVELSFAPLAIKQVLELAGRFLPESARGLQVQSGKVAGGLEIYLASGSVVPEKLFATVTDLKMKTPLMPLPIEGFSGSVTYRGNKVIWEKLEATLPGIKAVSGKGDLDLSSTDGSRSGLAGNFALEVQVQLEVVLKHLSTFLPETLLALNPIGNVDFKGNVNLRGAETSVDGILQVLKARVVIPQVKMPIDLEKGRLKLVNAGRNSGSVEIEELSARLLGNDLKFKGTLTNPANPLLNLTGVADVDLAQLHAAMPMQNEWFKKSSAMSGRAKVEARLGGTMKKPELNASVQLVDADFAVPEKKLRFSQIAGLVKADLNSVVVEKLKASVAGGKMSIDGRLTDFAKTSVNASATLTGIDLVEVRSFLAQNFPTFPKTLEFGGKADLEVGVNGLVSGPRVNGTAVLAGDRFQHPAIMRPLTGIVGPVKFDNKGLQTEGLQLNWGSSTVRLVGKIDDWGLFKLAFNYAVQPLDLTDIGQFFLAGTGYRVDGNGSGEGKVSGPIDKLVVEGTALLPSGEFQAPISKSGPGTFKFPFTSLKAPFRFTEGVLDLTNLQADIFSGKFGGSGKIFVSEKPIRFLFDTKATAVETQQFLGLNTTQKNVLSGPVNLTFKAGGNTNGLDSLDGGSTMEMKKGHYQSPPVFAQVMGLLNAGNLSAGDLIGLNGGFVFKGGKVHSEDLLFKTSLGHATYKGTVGLDTSLNGTLYLQLSAAACKESSILQQLSPDGSPVDIPIGLKGSLLSPSIDLKLEKLLETAAKKKVKSLITDAILGGGAGNMQPANASGTPVPVKKKSTEQKILEGLGKVLGGGKKQPDPEPVPAPAPAPGQTGQASATPVTPPPAPAPVPAPTPEDKLKKELQKGLKNIQMVETNPSQLIVVEERGPVVVVLISGFFDEKSGRVFLEEIRQRLDKKFIRFVFDFSKAKSLSSPAVANVLEISQIIEESYAGKTVFSGLSPLNLKVFEMVGILGFGSVFSTHQEAEAEVAKD